MNKYQEYQEALDILKNIEQSHKYKQIGSSLTPESDLLQELVNEKLAKPTEEEIKKEWEALGYVWGDGKNCLSLFKEDEVRLGFAKTIMISFVRKHYSAVYEENMYDEECYTCVPCDITLQEHQLLTKTFKMLGWEVEDAN